VAAQHPCKTPGSVEGDCSSNNYWVSVPFSYRGIIIMEFVAMIIINDSSSPELINRIELMLLLMTVRN
jgi:hypothetical protein